MCEREIGLGNQQIVAKNINYRLSQIGTVNERKYSGVIRVADYLLKQLHYRRAVNVVLKTNLGYERHESTTRNTRLFFFFALGNDGFVRVQNIFYTTNVIHII